MADAERSVPVMRVRIVRVRVRHSFVAMHVRVRFRTVPRGIVSVLVMIASQPQ